MKSDFICIEPETETEIDEPPSRLSALVQALHKNAGMLPGDVGGRYFSFARRFFPSATESEWNDWQWQLRNRVTSLEKLEQILNLSKGERTAICGQHSVLPLSITPYYLSLLDRDLSDHPLRRTVVPSCNELIHSPGEEEDPLGEDADSPVPGLIHRYPDRVLFLATDFCSTYCRYCTRSRMVGKKNNTSGSGVGHWQKAISYIEATPSIRDVILSGGDPLTLPDDKLEWILSRLHRIPHVQIIRIGTKVPAVLPQRITPELVAMLRKYHPLWMSIHCAHPDEQTPEMIQACTRLADAGIPLGSQTVLLSGINDSVETMTRLVHGLLRMRIKPYYLYQCDPIVGSAHFRTPVAKGLEIYAGLRGHTSGYAVPNYVIDAPGGGGKIPLLPDTVVGRDGDYLLLRNYQGNTYRYPDTMPGQVRKP